MDSMAAFAMGESARRRGSAQRVFDWNTAARRIVETKATHAAAGLGSDWEYTGGEIFADNKPVPEDDTYVYLSSNWATPELRLDHGAEEDCWVYQSDTEGWDAHTYWPQSALDILNEDVIDVEVIPEMKEIEK